MTRQQRRAERRKQNKAVVRASRKLAVQRMSNEEGKAALANYKLSSKDPATLLACTVFTEDTKIDEFIHVCHEWAETLDNNNIPKWIIFIKETAETPLPAPKRELMKICTRIFKKAAPQKPCLFLDMTQEEFDNGNVGTRIYDFIVRFNDIYEGDEFPDWLHGYIYKETHPYD